MMGPDIQNLTTKFKKKNKIFQQSLEDRGLVLSTQNFFFNTPSTSCYVPDYKSKDNR